VHEALCLGLVEVDALCLIWVPALSLMQVLVGFIEVCYCFDVYVVPAAAAVRSEELIFTLLLEVKAGLEFFMNLNTVVVFIAYGYFV